MKLKTKITLASVSLLLILSQAFSIWNLSKTQGQIIENIQSYESDKLNTDINRFERDLIKEEFQDDRGIEYAARTVFRNGYSDYAALYYNGKELCNISPYLFTLPEVPDQTETDSDGTPPEPIQTEVFLEEINGRHLMILSREIDIRALTPSLTSYGPFRILHYRDVTSVYESKRLLFFQGIAVTLLLSALLAVLLTLILGKILAPFYLLRDAANVIAEGDYHKRVEHLGNDEVGEVSQSFNKMAERIEEHIRTLAEMNEKQRQLIGSLAHELKTPMTGIQGYAELLQRVQLPPHRQADALQYIEEECVRLSRLSAKMLQLTALSGEKEIEKTSCSITALFTQAKEITHYRLKEKEIRLKIDLEQDVQIEGDEDLLISFLTNLIDNACKASPPGSCIRLIGTTSGIFVQDEGQGIPKDEIEKITEPFYMVNKSRSRKEGGAGLGLSLCLQIARLHGGKLEIESTTEKGTCIGMNLDIT